MSELDSSNFSESASPPARTARNKKFRARFSSWSLHFTFSADSTALNGGGEAGCVTLRERQTFLRAHIKSRVEHTMPNAISFVTAFYDASIISGVLPEGVSLSISLRAYVQTRAMTSYELTTMQNWMPSAVWNPVRGGLASNSEFKADVSRSEDPNDQWTQMIVLGGLGLNNSAKMERKKLRDIEGRGGSCCQGWSGTGREQGFDTRRAEIHRAMFPSLS